MKLDFPDKDWQEKAPADLHEHKNYKQLRKLLAGLKDTDAIKDIPALEEARQAAEQIGGLLNQMFTEIGKKVKAEDRKPYNTLNSKWKTQADDYVKDCSRRVEELEDAKAGANSEMVLTETKVVFKHVEKEVSKLAETAEKLFRQLQQLRKEFEVRVDRMAPGDKDGYETIRQMNQNQMQARKVVNTIATCSLKAQQLKEGHWLPMLKHRTGLTKAHRNEVDKMADGLNKSIHQLEHNETEAAKLVGGLKQLILQAGAVLQGGVEEGEIVAGKLRRLVGRLESDLLDCDNRHAYDASGRLDGCEGDLNNYIKFEGDEKAKWGEAFKRRLLLTGPSIVQLETSLGACKKELDTAMNGFRREQLDMSNPAIKKALEDLDVRIKFMVEIRKKLQSYQERLAKVKKKAGEAGLTGL